MNQYVINGSFNKYTNIQIGSDIESIRDSLIVAIMDRELDERVMMVYQMIERLVQNSNRVILVSVNDRNKCFVPVANMMVLYRRYDIYEVEIKSVVSAEWIDKAVERHPDINEVQTFLGGDVVAYNELSALIIGLEEAVESGDVEGIKKFIEEHMPALEDVTTTLNKMKKTCDMADIDEMNSLITEYKNRVESVTKDSKVKADQIKSLQDDNEELNKALAELRDTCSDLRVRLEDSEVNDGSGGVVQTYSTVQLGSVANHVKHVIYFKEISYIPYINSLIMQFTGILKSKFDGKVKLLVYDTNTELYQAYNPLRIVDGREYAGSKSDFVNKIKEFVVSEPNPAILTDMLATELDVLIIYDRMHGAKDLVAGTLLTKFFVLNSNTEYVNYKAKLNIVDPSNIITRAGALKEKTLDIPYVEGYSGNTPSAKTARYAKLVTSKGEPLIMTMCKKARIEIQ